MHTKLRLANGVHSVAIFCISGWALRGLAVLLMVLVESPGLASNQRGSSATSPEVPAPAEEATQEGASGEPVAEAVPRATDDTGDEGRRAEVDSNRTQLASTSAADHANVLRSLFAGACAESRSLPPWAAGRISEYVGALADNDAAEIFDRAGLTYAEALAAQDLAQRQQNNESDIWSGTYDDSAFRNAFRTLTAPFLAPDLMRMRRVAYTYSLKDLLDERDNATEQNLRNMILRGEVAVARYDEQNRTYRLILPDDESWRDGVSRCVQCHSQDAAPAYDSVRLIAPGNRLLGAATDGRVMAWDARQRLGGAILDKYCGVVNMAPWGALIGALRPPATLPEAATIPANRP